MTVSVGNDVVRPTHDLSLSDGTNTIGLITCDNQGNRNPMGINRRPYPRTAMKTTSGNQTYDDFEPPWSPVAQEDWSGGRGLEVFDQDVTRYYDGRRCNTLFANKIFNGPQETYTNGYRSQDKLLPGSVEWQSLTDAGAPYWATKFTASASYTAANISLWLKRTGTPANNLIVEVCSDSPGNPGTVLQNGTITKSNVRDYESEFYSITISQALTASTAYWIKVRSSGGTNTNCWKVASQDSGSNGKNSANGTVWSAADPIYFRITDANDTYVRKLFRYNYVTYFYKNTGGAPELWMNGYRGVAKSNAANKTLLNDNGSPAWTINEWAGCTVMIIGGLGQNETKRWRRIVSNTGDVLTCDEDWVITHDTTTDYVIIGSDKWTQITGHGLTGDITSVFSNNKNLYVCQGDGINIRRIRWTVSEGAGSHTFADDGTNKAFKLCTCRDTNDGLVIWKANNSDASGNISVAVAPIPTVGNNMVFNTAVPFQDDLGRITNIGEYGGETKKLWVFRESSIFAMTRSGSMTYVADEIPLQEMHSCGDWQNGEVAITHGTYYYFSYKEGIERYYNLQLDDVGPNRDEGLPTNRRGVVSCMAGFPGKLFVSMDGDTTGYSSILAQAPTGEAGSGWCELYRAPSTGLRIHSILFEPIPGSVIDRLWAVVGSDIIWLPSAIQPLQDSNYTYVHECSLTTGYIYCGLYEIYKFFHSIFGIGKNLGSTAWIEVDYRKENETAFTPIVGDINATPSDEIEFDTTSVGAKGINCKRIQLRFRLLTTSNSTPAILIASVLDNISRVPVKYAYGVAYRVMDQDRDINGEKDSQMVDTKQNLLDQWATQLTPLTLRTNYGRFDNKTVFIDPATMTPVTANPQNKTDLEAHIETFTIIEI